MAELAPNAIGRAAKKKQHGADKQSAVFGKQLFLSRLQRGVDHQSEQKNGDHFQRAGEGRHSAPDGDERKRSAQAPCEETPKGARRRSRTLLRTHLQALEASPEQTPLAPNLIGRFPAKCGLGF